jgi:hypothetical protein
MLDQHLPNLGDLQPARDFFQQDDCNTAYTELLHPESKISPQIKAKLAFIHYMNEALISGPVNKVKWADPKYIVSDQEKAQLSGLSSCLQIYEESILCEKQAPMTDEELKAGFKTLNKNAWRKPAISHTLNGIVGYYQSFLLDAMDEAGEDDCKYCDFLVTQFTPVVEWTATFMRYFVDLDADDEGKMFTGLQMLVNPQLMEQIRRESGNDSQTVDNY